MSCAPARTAAPEVLEHVPGPKSILLADEFQSAASLGARIRELLDDEREFEAYHAWDLDEFRRRDTVKQCPWQCRACEWVSAERARAKHRTKLK